MVLVNHRDIDMQVQGMKTIEVKHTNIMMNTLLLQLHIRQQKDPSKEDQSQHFFLN